MDPPIRPDLSPPFHELDEYTFQRLCRDLFEEQEGISTCAVYGERGERQDGIDLLAHRAAGDETEVGQCKCCAEFPPAAIRAASDEFFEHLDHWRQENVRGFILFVACDLSGRRQQDEIANQIRRFAKAGIIYEAWDAATIRNRLRTQSGIVATYLGSPEYWVPRICGETAGMSWVGPGRAQGSMVEAALITQTEQLTERLSGEVGRRLDEMRAAWREGSGDVARTWIRGVREDNSLWRVLSPEVRANLLRFQASLELDAADDISQAERLAAEARSLAASPRDAILQALITYRRDGAAAALEPLADACDTDGLNLRAVLLLEAGRLGECRSTLDGAALVDPSSAETLRVGALLRLVSGDLPGATLQIQKALERQPRWQAIRFAAGVIYYFGTLSRAAVPRYLPSWPEPVEWTLVRRDDEALSRRRDAAELFRTLALGDAWSEAERQDVEAWRLACLADDPDRQDEAEAYCRQLLETKPSHYQAIVWCLARGLGVDLAPSRDTIEGLLAQCLATLPQALALVSIYLAAERGDSAALVLEATRELFQASDAAGLWSLLSAQAAALGGDPESALAQISTLEPADARTARAVVMRFVARKTEDWEPLLRHLQESCDESHDPRFVLESCETMAYRGSWRFVADRAEWLVCEIGTADALRLAAMALYNIGDHEASLALLEDHRGLFPEGRLSAELRRLRVACQHSLGILPGAIANAEALAQDEPTTRNLLSLADLHFAVGDYQSLCGVARRIAARPDLTPVQALRLAWLAQIQDRQLATLLWRRALGEGLPDDSVAAALNLGYQLGLDREVGPLTARMTNLAAAGQPGVQLFAIEDFVSFIEQRRQHLTEAEESYRRGQLPVHFFAAAYNLPLVNLYHGLLEANEAALRPHLHPPLFVRHGGRTQESSSTRAAERWRIHLDLTAILLAEHLEILEQVECVFKPLRIPSHTMAALFQMREALAHRQPALLEARRQVLRLHQEGALEVVDDQPQPDDALVEQQGEEWAALLRAAQGSGGYLLDYLPLRKLDGSPITLPEGLEAYLVNCRAVAQALRTHGPLSEEAFTHALEALGTEGRSTVSTAIPQPGAALYCHGNLPEVLAGAGLLHPACERFRVRVGRRTIDRIRAELYEEGRRRELADWLDALRRRLSQGIAGGTYQVMPETARTDDEPEDTAPSGPVQQCMLDLLRFDPGDDDVVWIDDRFLTSYLLRGTAPIVGIKEILDALRARGTLSPASYFQKLSQLRAANCRFIPVEPDEIVHHLRQATIHDGRVVETQELVTLRRYAAACLLDADALQRPPMPPNAPQPTGEVAFLVGLGRAISDALVSIWDDPEIDESTATARSEWLLGNLFLDYGTLARVASLLRPDQDARSALAMTLAGLMARAITLRRRRSGGEPSRRAFFNWLFQRVLLPRFGADPGLLATLVESLKQLIANTDLEDIPGPRDEMRPVVRAVLGAFYQDLPKPIQDELLLDADFMATIGVTVQDAVTFGDVAFAADGFWGAARAAVNGQEATITALQPPVQITLRPFLDSHGRPVCCFSHPTSGDTVLLTHDDLDLLSGSPSSREATLRRLRHWFDCPAEVFERVVTEIASMDDPGERAAAARSWRDTSAAFHFAALRRALSERPQFKFDELLPPSAGGLLQYLRLGPEAGARGSFSEALSGAARSLIDDLGLQEAAIRIAGLPVPLPEPFIETLEQLPAEERHAHIRMLLRTAGSPTSMVHLIRVLVRLQDGCPAYGRLARQIIRRLLSDEGIEAYEALLALAKWTNDRLSLQPDVRAWPSHIRLVIAWASAHRLFAVLTSTGAPTTWLRETFSEAAEQVSPDWVERDPNYWFDLAHPRNVRPLPLLLAGVSYALGEHAQELVDQQLRELFASHAFPASGTGLFPAPDLLRDPTLASDSLSSFLGGDRGPALTPIIGPDGAGLFSRPALQQAAANAVEKLADPDHSGRAWAQLYAILGDLPPYGALVDQLSVAIKQVDFADLVEKDLDLGIFALHTATIQALHVTDHDLRDNLKHQLIGAATFLASRRAVDRDIGRTSEDAQDGSPALHFKLLDAALNVCTDPSRPATYGMTEFGKLVIELAGALPFPVPLFGLVIQRLCEDLPASLTQSLWPTLVRLRAE